MLYTPDKPNGTLTLPFGAFDGHLIGAPYPYSKKLPSDVLRVKLAPEIKMECDVELPIVDFSVPRDTAQVHRVLIAVIHEMSKGRHVFAGCMGGRGRTGLFFALLAKVALDYEATLPIEQVGELGGVRASVDPVKLVRERYYLHAVETPEQKNYVENFDTSPVVAYVESLQPVIAPTLLERILSGLRSFCDAVTGFFTGRRSA